MNAWKQEASAVSCSCPGFASIFVRRHRHRRRADDRPNRRSTAPRDRRLHAKIAQDERRKRPSLRLARRRRPHDRSLRTPELHRSSRTGIAKKKSATSVGSRSAAAPPVRVGRHGAAAASTIVCPLSRVREKKNLALSAARRSVGRAVRSARGTGGAGGFRPSREREERIPKNDLKPGKNRNSGRPLFPRIISLFSLCYLLLEKLP
jgi:hypothetical protein